MQLRLDLAESPAPAAVLWELVGEQQRQTAVSVLAALIVQTVAPGAGGDERDERVPGACADPSGWQDDSPGRWWWVGAGDGVSER